MMRVVMVRLVRYTPTESKIPDEDSFQAHIMKSHGWFAGYAHAHFPKVTKIAGEQISPEIDLVNIDFSNKKITGYEFKLLKYQTSDANYKRVHEGIGQTILYFQHGIDRCYLVLGIHSNLSARASFQVARKISRVTEHLKKIHNYVPYLGLAVWKEKEDSLSTHIATASDFPISSYEDIRHKKECLLRREFSWSNKFLADYGLPLQLRLKEIGR